MDELLLHSYTLTLFYLFGVPYSEMIPTIQDFNDEYSV